MICFKMFKMLSEESYINAHTKYKRWYYVMVAVKCYLKVKIWMEIALFRTELAIQVSYK